ncbi:metallophosphoesterase family protein [Thermophagus sp. OGC60D27]|uniref:metallophosphoesterase family protein n=1 Tax=Thermophagus sp. OGC60D27 TaxID=3458415 RepID=UPI004037600A
MSVKILATGDLHIGKRSSGLTNDADEMATKHTWGRIVDMVINNDFNILVLTGDIVDRDNRYFEAIGPLQSGFSRLKEAGIPIFMVAGNHDYDVLRQVADPTKYENIRFLGINGKWDIKTISVNGQTIRFAGWSFPAQHVVTNPLQELDIDISEEPTIGLLHSDLESNNSHYAPVRTENFLEHPVDAWILGHIHKPQIIRDTPPIVRYPGSPQALSPKEQGIHGPLQIIVESKNNIHIEQIPLSPVRYETISIDISEAKSEEILRKWVVDKTLQYKENNRTNLLETRFLILDILLIGQHPNVGNVEAWMSTIQDTFNYDYEEGINITVRKVDYDIMPTIEHLSDLAKESSPAGLLAETILAIQNGQSTPLLNQLIKKWKNSVERINNSPTYHRLKTNHRIVKPDDHTAKREILTQCRRLLAELLIQKSEK